MDKSPYVSKPVKKKILKIVKRVKMVTDINNEITVTFPI